MPVPKRRTGKAKKNMRRSHHALTPMGLSENQDTGERTPQHRVCLKTGYYKGRQVIPVKD